MRVLLSTIGRVVKSADDRRLCAGSDKSCRFRHTDDDQAPDDGWAKRAEDPLLLEFSNVQDPSAIRFCQWASDAYRSVSAFGVLIPCLQLSVCISLIVCEVFDFSGVVVPLQLR